MNARDNQLCGSFECQIVTPGRRTAITIVTSCRCRRGRTSYLEVRREARAFELQSWVLRLLWAQHTGDGCSASGHRMFVGKIKNLHVVHMFFLGV